MKTPIKALLAFILAIIALTGIYVSVDSVWSSGEEEVNQTGETFTDCLGDVTSQSDTDCGLFDADGDEDD